MLKNLQKVLGIEIASLMEQGGALTANEFAQQPHVWGEIQNLIENQRSVLSTFLTPLLAQQNLRIIMTGAGTSAFIGACLAPAMLKTIGRRVEAIPTTDLVSGPQLYFQRQVPTLMISFARSGSSPESVAAIALADQMVEHMHHLVITCNADGKLYRHAAQSANYFAILLPDETHDRGFAMTTSFTSMLLAAALVFDVIDGSYQKLAAIGAATTELLTRALPMVNALVQRKFKRVVYLGSNELKGLAQEAALKLLELSDGQVVAMFDSPLGFRHGPKTIIESDTLVIIMLSNDAHARCYDLDLLQELRSDGRAGQVVVLSAQADLLENENCLHLKNIADVSDIELALPYIVFAQIFAFMQSLALGIRPDTPSVSGTVNRVVSGVTIYPLSLSVKE